MLKIFCVYHKPYHLFSSDAVEPIQTGCVKASEDLKILRDDKGDNISHKNKNYGELSAWYWVWKNYLPKHPEIDYVGFCHYRRFLNFTPKKIKKRWQEYPKNKFKKLFERYYISSVLSSQITDDIILPKITKFKDISLQESYDNFHPKAEMEKFVQIACNKYPEEKEIILNTLNGNKGYFALNFVMRKELFENFMNWLFPLLFELEKQSDWSRYSAYNDVRAPAYLVERIFNIWLNIITQKKVLSICEKTGFLLVPEAPFWKKIVRPFLFLLPKKKRKKIKQNWYK